jgi:hypothetical protein
VHADVDESNALIACFNSNELKKKDGAWHGLPDGKPTSGTTIADLARDGMLTSDRGEVGPFDGTRKMARANSAWRCRRCQCSESKIVGEWTTHRTAVTSRSELAHQAKSSSDLFERCRAREAKSLTIDSGSHRTCARKPAWKSSSKKAITFAVADHIAPGQHLG